MKNYLSENLQNAFHALSQQMYAQEQSAPSPDGDFPNYGGNGPAPNGSGHNPEEDEDEVVEGEFTEA